MDIISTAMEKKLHLCESIKIENQTWENFLKASEKKKVFVFGIGGGMGYFLRNCCRIKIFGVIDNDKNKQNQKLGLYCADAWKTEYENMVIHDPDILASYGRHDIVILITSTNFYYPIVKQLEQMDIKNYYIMLMLEADKRKHSPGFVGEDFKRIREEYVKKCCNEKIVSNKIVMLIGVYGGHARQITKALLRETKVFDIVWIVDKLNKEKPDGVRIVYWKHWKQYIYEMETARVWVYDDLVPEFIKKRENQYYIQAKHWSSITLKKFYLEDKSSLKSTETIDTIKRDGERMDYLFSGSKFDEDSCRSGFGFKGKAIRVGSPRSDILFDRTIRRKVLDNWGLDEKVKICLYVPTYRLDELEKTSSMSISLNMDDLLKILNERWRGEWFLFVRLHPSLKLNEDDLSKSIHIINAGEYPDSEELVAGSDILITDYSSIMFEQAYRKKPVFLYAPDRQEYIDVERGLLIDYDKLPFPIAESNRELCMIIKNFDFDKYKESVTNFLDKYSIHEDGHASKRAAVFIMDLLKNAKDKEI